MDDGREATEAGLIFEPNRGTEVLYSAATAFFVLTSTRAVLIAVGGVGIGAVWWAFVGFQRNQPNWWFGFAIGIIALASVFVLFAAGVYLRERRSPPFVVGKSTRSSIRPDTLSFTFTNGSRELQLSDVSAIRSAFGFVLLRSTDKSTFLVVPKALLPVSFTSTSF